MDYPYPRFNRTHSGIETYNLQSFHVALTSFNRTHSGIETIYVPICKIDRKSLIAPIVELKREVARIISIRQMFNRTHSGIETGKKRHGRRSKVV